MKIYKAIELLQSNNNILLASNGDRLQRYTHDKIMVTYCKKRMKKENSNSIGGTIKNDKFIEEFKDFSFNQELQWFQQGELKLPRLCKVKESGWSDYKIVMINYFNGSMFSTGFSESYMPSYDNSIEPLTNQEIERLKISQ